MHIVHTYKKTGGLGAVLGFFFDREAGGNEDNPLIESLKFDQTVEGAAITVDDVALADFLATADFSEYWSYPGSLTVPPCVEGIKWTVIKKILPISDAQLNAFNQFFSDNEAFANGLGNNRLIQPLKARTLYFIEEEKKDKKEKKDEDEDEDEKKDKKKK
jgi:carbonic anhydrase